MTNPVWRFGCLSVGLAIVFTVALSFLIDPIPAWIASINLVALIIYRYDKAIAGSKKTRVPEKILIVIEVMGGTLGAVVAMWFIHPSHKTQSGGFLIWFLLIAFLQMVVSIAFIYFVRV